MNTPLPVARKWPVASRPPPVALVRRKLRVVVADDSPTMRFVLREILAADPEIEVVGVASNGDEAVSLVLEHSPDLVTMDVAMPRLDGIGAIQRIMAERPTPVVVVSGLPSVGRAGASFDAIGAGAVDVVAKPGPGQTFQEPSARRRFLAHLKNMAKVAVVRRKMPVATALSPDGRTSARVIAVGVSTGGPPVLAETLASLGPGSPPVMVVQHMAEGFLEGFATWLDRQLGVRVTIATGGTAIEPGTVYLAPANRHLELTQAHTLRVHDGAPVNFHRPSVEVLFESVARHAGRGAVGAILTGMGRDGALALGSMHRAGALTLAQEPSTCVVPGMPTAAIEIGAVDEIATPAQLRARVGMLVVDRTVGRD